MATKCLHQHRWRVDGFMCYNHDIPIVCSAAGLISRYTYSNRILQVNIFFTKSYCRVLQIIIRLVATLSCLLR